MYFIKMFVLYFIISIERKNTTVNIQSNTKKCFKHSILAKHLNWISYQRTYVDDKNVDCSFFKNYFSNDANIKLTEKLNLDVSVNNLSLKKRTSSIYKKY